MAPGRLALNTRWQTGHTKAAPRMPLEALSVVGASSAAGATWKPVGHGKEGERDGFMG
jgi:hypothetical protein